MARLQDECYMDVAHRFLDHETILQQMFRLPRDVARLLPNTIITEFVLEEIEMPTTNSGRAAGMIKKALKDSVNAKKIEIFLKALKDVDPERAEQISVVYKELLESHSCSSCILLPETPLHEPVQEAGVAVMEEAETTTPA